MPRPRRGHAPLVAITAELAAWWLVTVGVWMASLSAFSWHDLVVAAGCAVPCALCARGGRRAVQGRWRLPGDTWRWLALLPVAIVTDAVRVFALPFRRQARDDAGFTSIDLAAPGDSAAAAGRRAAASLLLSTPPGSYVVSVDPDDGSALVHTLGGETALQRAITR